MISTSNPSNNIYHLLDHTSDQDRTRVFLEWMTDKNNHPFRLRGTNNNPTNLRWLDLRSETVLTNFTDLLNREPWWWNAKNKQVQLRQIDFSNTDLSHSILENVDLSESKFRKSIFTNTILSNANLSNSRMDFAEISHTIADYAKFRDANLSEADIDHSSFKYADFDGAILKRSTIKDTSFYRCYLNEANLTESSFISVKLCRAEMRSADLRGTRLRGTNFTRAVLCSAHLQDLDLTDCDLINVSLEDARLEGSIIREDQLRSAILEDIERNYNQAKRAYMQLKQYFDQRGEYDAASRMYQKERDMETNHLFQQSYQAFWMCFLNLKHFKPFLLNGLRYFSNFTSGLICGYGESTHRVLICILVIILFIGPITIFICGGLISGNQDSTLTIQNLDQFESKYFLLILYTLDTLTTASFSELKPATDSGRLASGVLAFTGIFLAGLLGFVSGNRIRRS